MASESPPIRLLIDRRRARFEFELFDTFEAGLSLLGTEVKSLRRGLGNLAEAWIRLDRQGATLVGCHISPHREASQENHDPIRPRRLLLHGHELLKLQRATRLKGMTVVPTKLYLKGSRIKLEIALAKGKNVRDKRRTVRERDAKREMERGRR